MMWSWRSRAIRSRSVRTSSSRIRRCALASCRQRGLVSKGGHNVEPALQPILSMVLASWGAPRRQQVS